MKFMNNKGFYDKLTINFDTFEKQDRNPLSVNPRACWGNNWVVVA
jgi:hypothetical protein